MAAFSNNRPDKMRRRLSDSVFLSRLDILVLLAVALLGVTKLILPFSNDQAVATLAAVGMRDGAVLYRDLWDVRQPGIFYFFLVGGSLFGFNEVGIHIFELLCLLTFAAMLLLTLRGHFHNQRIASLIPLFTVGMYYGISGDWHLTQPESLMGVPTFLCLWFAAKSLYPGSRRKLWMFMSGVMGGIVLLFKFIFLLILAAFWLTLFYRSLLKKDKAQVATVFGITVPLVLGVLLPLLLVGGHLAYGGALNVALWTFFQYPTLAAREWPLLNRVGVLISSVNWFISNFAPLMALSVIGAYASSRSRKDFLTLNLMLWIALGLLVIVLQPLSWWQYHFMMLFVPLGILAVRGLDVLWPRVKRWQAPATRWQSGLIAALSILLLLSPTLTSVAMKTVELARNGFLTKEDRLKYQTDFSNDYRISLQETAFLRQPVSLSGTIFALGDVLYYYLSGRRPAIPYLNAAGYSPPELWERILNSLYENRPSYIFIPKNKLAAVRRYTPRAAPYIDGTARFIQLNYDVWRESNTGTWYVIRDSASTSRQARFLIYGTE